MKKRKLAKELNKYVEEVRAKSVKSMSVLKKKTLAARKAIRPKRIRPTRLQIKNRAKKAKFDELLPPGIMGPRMKALSKMFRNGSLEVAPPIRESGKSIIAQTMGGTIQAPMAGMPGAPLTIIMDEDEAAIHDIYKENLIDYQLELECEGCGQSIFFAFVMATKIENNVSVMGKADFKQSIVDNLALSDQEMRHVKQETGVGCYFCGRYIFKRVWQCVEGIE